MKNVIFILIFSLAYLSLNAQIKPKKGSINPVDNSIPELKGCDLTMYYYKKFVFHALKKPNNSTLSYTKAIPEAGVVYKNNQSYLTFGKVMKKRPIPSFGPHAEFSDINVYGGIMLEGWVILETINHISFRFGLYYEAGNYDNIIEVTDIYRQGNRDYAEVKRPNGSLEQVRLLPNFVLENGCQLEER